MDAKKTAADRAVDYVQQGMTVGLGTGSTAAYAIAKIGAMAQQGLDIKAVASSLASEKMAREKGIRISDFSTIQKIDLYIDGADEVDRKRNLIKGGGGALLREKILAYHSKEFIVIVDGSKCVEQLGRFHLPVELIRFAVEMSLQSLRELGCRPKIRSKEGQIYITDNGNFIADCDFGNIQDPSTLNEHLNKIPGVAEHGLFPSEMVSKLVIGYDNGEIEDP
jgi:ribose 5-phosphate isomerase A